MSFLSQSFYVEDDSAHYCQPSCSSTPSYDSGSPYTDYMSEQSPASETGYPYDSSYPATPSSDDLLDDSIMVAQSPVSLPMPRQKHYLQQHPSTSPTSSVSTSPYVFSEFSSSTAMLDPVSSSGWRGRQTWPSEAGSRTQGEFDFVYPQPNTHNKDYSTAATATMQYAHLSATELSTYFASTPGELSPEFWQGYFYGQLHAQMGFFPFSTADTIMAVPVPPQSLSSHINNGGGGACGIGPGPGHSSGLRHSEIIHNQFPPSDSSTSYNPYQPSPLDQPSSEPEYIDAISRCAAQQMASASPADAEEYLDDEDDEDDDGDDDHALAYPRGEDDADQSTTKIHQPRPSRVIPLVSLTALAASSI